MDLLFGSITGWLSEVMKQYGILAVFIGMIIESACIPLPSEIIMPLGGLFVHKGTFGILSLTIAGTLGNVVGGALAYFAGRYGGRKFIRKYGRYILLSEKHLDQAESWFSRRGEMTVFWSRLLPGIRTFISLPAGVAQMDFKRFVIYTTLGSFPWALGLTYVGYFFGQNWDVMISYLHEMNYVVWALTAVGIIFWYWSRRKKALQRKRMQR